MENANPNERRGVELRKGDSNSGVLALQVELNNAGYGPLLRDGQFGAATELAVMDAQKALKQQVTGAAPRRLLAALGLEDAPEVRARRVVQSVWDRFSDDIVDACLDHGVVLYDALALLSAESGMMGMWKPGLPVLRFDAECFRQHVPPDVFNRVFQADGVHLVRDEQSGEWHITHSGRQDLEYFALSAASVHSLHGAYESCRMGAAMIPGAAYKTLGYATALDMFVGFGDEQEQVRGLLAYAMSQSKDGSRWDRYAAARYPEMADGFREYLTALRDVAVLVAES